MEHVLYVTLHALYSGMRKTSVYLTEEEAEGLRRAADISGRSQAELIREGIHRMLTELGAAKREFHSMGKGHGGGASYREWNADELYETVMGRQ